MSRLPDSPAEPSDLELQVLSVLWERGPCRVRHVMERMPDGKERAYTTVLTVLQGLEKKGLVRHEQAGKQYIYRAVASRQGVLRPRLRRLVSHVFGGRPSAVLQQLLDGTKIAPEDLAEMRKLIAEHEKQSGREKRGKKP